MAFIDYLTDTDPGSVGAGKTWCKLNGDLSVRNSANLAWTVMGNINSVRLGALSSGGGNVTGAFTGAHGLAPNANPDFQGSVKRLGIDLVDTVQLEDAAKAMREEFSSILSQTISSSSASIDIGNYVGFECGTVSKTCHAWRTEKFQLTLPTYTGSVTAPITDCKWGAAFSRLITASTYVTQFNAHWEILWTPDANPPELYVQYMEGLPPDYDDEASWLIDVTWFIMAIRKA